MAPPPAQNEGSSLSSNATPFPATPGTPAADATKRARTSRPKVKTGCSNCKQRRIKCDEKRPACSQCVRSKKECTGYPPPPRGSRPFEEIRIAPKPILLAAAAPALAPAPAAYQKPYQPLQQIQQQQPHRQQQQQQPQQQQQQITQRRAQKLHQRRNMPARTPIAAIAAIAAINTTANGYDDGTTILYHPSINLPFTSQEGLYFQLFRMQTANELSGFFDDVFWSRIVLIECHSEAAIRHAVVALGALYKTLEKTTESPPASPTGPDYDGHGSHDSHDNARMHWQVALRQYSDACTELAYVNSDDERTQRTRLMASVLLACFDSFIGHHKQAIRQIQTGLGFLHQLRVERRSAQADPLAAPEPVEDELIQMFTRLAIQAKSYDMAFHFPQPYVIQLLSSGQPAAATAATATASKGASDPAGGVSSPPPAHPLPTSTHQEAIPDQFTSLRQARLAWDSMCEHIFRFMEFMMQHANAPPNLLPKSMQQYGLEFKIMIETWSNAFESLLLSRANPGVSSQEKTGIAVLKMFQIMGQILYLMTFSDSEMMFDAFQQQFRAIVDLAGEVVGDQERQAAANRCPDPTRCVHQHHDHQHQWHDYAHYPTAARHIKASFSADLGIVPPLYVVATKSRDRVLRRQAIELLRSSARREGMWDSELAARIGMWVVEIEEEGEETEFYEALQRDNSFQGQSARSGSFGSFGSFGSLGSGGSGGSSGGGSPLTPSPAPTSRDSSVDFAAMQLGPGGNARWDAHRASQASVLHTTSSMAAAATSAAAAAAAAAAGLSTPLPSPPLPPSAFLPVSAPLDASLPYYMQTQFPIPAAKRILVKSCEFDLREHTAELKCGTRGLAAGAVDMKVRTTTIKW
ncbi:hypothetical protein SCUCBS95973_004247 [Sporothrix curviconia]|uniref:Zn(2)-C6 fungal-type domain-containing protein n=1 Tax=Sporothrix curviconia TaxID=1260050 RepID=A0ABP0BM74_9PEZI